MKLIAWAAVAALLVAGVSSCASSAPAEPRATPPAEMVTDGFWTAAVDPTGSVTPAVADQPAALLQDVDGAKAIVVSWTLGPDKSNGGSIWTWGQLDGYFTKDHQTADLSKYSIEITYMADTDIFVRVFTDPPVGVDGGQQRDQLDASPGKWATVKLDKADFMSPGWSKVGPADWHSIKAFDIIPILGQGGTSHLKIKSLKLTPAS